mmetsp:Transcript_15048/g.45485  ORF Transcript_15048/g.45485 Transcript_15048/m.45485 type:complete len:206 (+) Transcript_15048:1148-1765(+)
MAHAQLLHMLLCTPLADIGLVDDALSGQHMLDQARRREHLIQRVRDTIPGERGGVALGVLQGRGGVPVEAGDGGLVPPPQLPLLGHQELLVALLLRHKHHPHLPSYVLFQHILVRRVAALHLASNGTKHLPAELVLVVLNPAGDLSDARVALLQQVQPLSLLVIQLTQRSFQAGKLGLIGVDVFRQGFKRPLSIPIFPPKCQLAF